MEFNRQEFTASRSIPYDSTVRVDPPNIFISLLFWLISVGLILLVPAIMVVGYAGATGLAVTQKTLQNPTLVFIGVVAVIPAHLLTLAVAWMITTRMGKYSIRDSFGMGWGGFRWWHLVFCILGLFAILLASFSIFGKVPNEFDKLLASSRLVLYAVAVVATFSAPIVEEVIYRGILYGSVEKAMNVPVAVFIVTALFAAVHYPQYWGDVGTIVGLTAVSLVLTLVRVFTGNLLPCIALHFVFNGIQTSALILEPWIAPAAKKSPALFSLFS